MSRLTAEDLQRVLARLTTASEREVRALLRALVGGDVAEVRNGLIDNLPAMLVTFGGAAAAAAADYYDDLRESVGVKSRYAARPAGPATVERVEVLARWAVGPLLGSEPNVDVAGSKLAGGFSRLVMDQARDTVVQSAAADPAKPRWRRHARPGACAFCRMTATRGAVYASQATAQDHYHDDCHCVAIPEWEGEADYVAKWREEYAATEGRSAKEVLASWRANTGAS